MTEPMPDAERLLTSDELSAIETSIALYRQMGIADGAYALLPAYKAAIARLDRAEAAGAWRPTHRHVKRQKDVQVLEEADLQTDRPLEDYAVLTIYRGEDGRWWARPTSEFKDGRFEPLPAPPGATPAPPPADAAMREALREIGEERRRQAEAEGWTPEHDDRHTGRALVKAAISYAMSAASGMYTTLSEPPSWWPWERSWWKPKDRRRDLVRAAALIVAEIERLDRAVLAAAGADERAGVAE